MKILILGPGAGLPIPPVGYGGIEKVIWAHTVELRKRGHTVDIFNEQNPDRMIAQARQGYDVIHSHWERHNQTLIANDIPFIFTSHRSGWTWQWDELVKNMSAATLAMPFEQMGARLQTAGQWPIFNGADPALFKPGTKQKGMCLAVGKNEDRKKFADVIKCVQNTPGLNLVLIGPGNEVFAGQPKVQVMPNLPEREIASIMARAELFFHLADAEADCLVVKEACMAGCKLILSDYCRETLHLTNRLTAIQDDQFFHALAINNFTWAKVVDRLEQGYEQYCARPGHRRATTPRLASPESPLDILICVKDLDAAGRDRLRMCVQSLRSNMDVPFRLCISDTSGVSARDTLTGVLDMPFNYYHEPVLGPFNRSRTINNGVRHLIHSDQFVVLDSDIIVPGNFLSKLIHYWEERRTYVLGRLGYLREGHPQTSDWGTLSTHPTSLMYNSGFFMINTELYRLVNGMDEEYVGWAAEDEDLTDRLDVHTRGRIRKLQNMELTCWHQYHPSRSGAESTWMERNRARWKQNTMAYRTEGRPVTAILGLQDLRADRNRDILAITGPTEYPDILMVVKDLDMPALSRLRRAVASLKLNPEFTKCRFCVQDVSEKPIQEVLDRVLGFPFVYHWEPQAGPFNRSLALNCGFVNLVRSKKFIILDIDMLVPPNFIQNMIYYLADGVFCQASVDYLRERLVRPTWADCSAADSVCRTWCGGVSIVRANAYQHVNGHDIQYVGWGLEDTDFQERIRTAYGSITQLERDQVATYHQWHPDRKFQQVNHWQANKARFEIELARLKSGAKRFDEIIGLTDRRKK